MIVLQMVAEISSITTILHAFFFTDGTAHMLPIKDSAFLFVENPLYLHIWLEPYLTIMTATVRFITFCHRGIDLQQKAKMAVDINNRKVLYRYHDVHIYSNNISVRTYINIYRTPLLHIQFSLLVGSTSPSHHLIHFLGDCVYFSSFCVTFVSTPLQHL